MTRRILKVNNGPDKPALQRSLAYENERVEFLLDGDPFHAHIDHLEEQAESFSFEIKGHILTGDLRGQSFQGIYSAGTRRGSLALGIGS